MTTVCSAVEAPDAVHVSVVQRYQEQMAVQLEAVKHACSFANDSDAVAQDLHRECSAKGVPRKELSRYCPELEDQLCEMVFDQSFG